MEGGGYAKPVMNAAEAQISKRSLVSIRNDDILCLARAHAVRLSKNRVDEASEGPKNQHCINTIQ